MGTLRNRSKGRAEVAPLSTGSLPQRSAAGADVPSRRPLFRQEVIEFQQYNRQWGRVVPLQPLSTRLMVWCVVAASACVIAFLFFAQYARQETVAGYLTPSSGTAKVFAARPGTVSAVHVEQGQQVEAGQHLLTVATGDVDSGGEDVNGRILTTLQQQRQSLITQIASEVQRTTSEGERLTSQIQRLDGERSLIGLQMEAQRGRIRGSEQLAANGAKLIGKGLVSDIDQKHREGAVLEQQQGLITLDQQMAQNKGSLAEARFNLEQLRFTQAEKIQSLRNEISAVDQRIAEVNGKLAYIIKAPIAGRISLLQASVGQPANPQRLTMEIVPSGSALEAELFIPARAIGFVEVGQKVRILYDAFPYQRFGTYQGRITRLSLTVLMKADNVAPVELKEPCYKATVALDRPDVDARGRKVPLQPDMLLKADIILETRTLAHWLLAPLLNPRLQG
jgi:membrane fusion protein